MTEAVRRMFSIRQLWSCFCAAGWILALGLGGWLAPKIYNHLAVQIPSVREKRWHSILTTKQEELSVQWQDTRPLILFMGDSQIELGHWYDLFQGSTAVRNNGLSSAKIADVTTLAGTMADVHPAGVVIMCGVNSLFVHLSPDECAKDYEVLLTTVQKHLDPGFIMVLSIMPLRESAPDPTARDFNLKIGELNQLLQQLCKKHPAEFINVNPAVQDRRGGLAEEFTFDGLHLNPEGYHRIASVIRQHLPPPHS